MTTFVFTQNSCYEFDLELKQVRRLNGATDPTPRTGTDGQWRVYQSISEIEVGKPMLIQWPDAVPLLPGSPAGSAPATITSSVVSFSDHPPFNGESPLDTAKQPT